MGKNTIALVLGIMVLLSLNFVVAHEGSGEHSGIEAIYSSAEEIIEKNADCKDLHDKDLELLGEYYLKGMYSEEYDNMKLRMGGDGDERIHSSEVRAGLMQYCGIYFDAPGLGWVIGAQDMDNDFKSNNWFYWVLKGFVVAVLVLLVVLLYKKINVKEGKRK